jgi:hypothetical protein
LTYGSKSKEGERAEIDVKATNRREVACVECKGKGPGALVDAPEIQDWLDWSLPRIKIWLKLANNLPTVRRFEFYSSTGYTDGAAALIAKATEEHKKHPIRFFEGKDVVRMLRHHNERALVQIFSEHFEA